MRLVSLVVLALLLPVAAFAVPYNAGSFGFSADFPSQPTQGAAADSEHDANGKVISKSVMFLAKQQGVTVAVVVVDTALGPMQWNVNPTLASERDSFISGIKGTATTASTNSFKGRPALQFAFDTADHSLQGQGMVIYMATKQPRIYLVVAGHTPSAAAADTAALDRFFNSFRLTK